jgi:hypothetical protein
MEAALWAALVVRLALVARLAQNPEVVWLPGATAGYRDDVVYLQLFVRSALLASEPISNKYSRATLRPIPRPRSISSTCSIPALPSLVVEASAVPGRGDQTACVQADAFGSRHGLSCGLWPRPGTGLAAGAVPWMPSQEPGLNRRINRENWYR